MHVDLTLQKQECWQLVSNFAECAHIPHKQVDASTVFVVVVQRHLHRVVNG